MDNTRVWTDFVVQMLLTLAADVPAGKHSLCLRPSSVPYDRACAYVCVHACVCTRKYLAGYDFISVLFKNSDIVSAYTYRPIYCIQFITHQ